MSRASGTFIVTQSHDETVNAFVQMLPQTQSIGHEPYDTTRQTTRSITFARGCDATDAGRYKVFSAYAGPPKATTD